MFGLIISFVLLMCGTLPVVAQTPEDTVRWIYTSLSQPGLQGLEYLAAPDRRDHFFSRRMTAFHAANDSQGGACVDFGLAVPGNDYDAVEIGRSLTLIASGDAGRKSIEAQFTTFGQAARIAYDFVIEDGFWKIDDIAGPGWRVSQIDCPLRDRSAYCYRMGQDDLRLDLGSGGGGGSFSMFSMQANGHSCGAEGAVRSIQGGWVHEQRMDDGTLCRIEIMVTPEQGLRLTDVDWRCKPFLCGQRAVIQGLSFPRDSQVDCTRMPDPGY